MGVNSHIVNFSQIDKSDLESVGRKAVELGELAKLRIPIPDGFVITSHFFEEFLSKTGIGQKITQIRESTHSSLRESLPKFFEPIQKEIIRTRIPRHLTSEIHNFYRKLSGVFSETSLNIYSSVKGGKSMSFYNVKGDANLILKIKNLLAHYLDQPFSIIVQKSVKSKNKKTIATNDAIVNQDVLKLAKKIQKYFYFPQEIEYFIEKGKILVTDIKPLMEVIKESVRKTVKIKNFKKEIIKGISINPGIVTGAVRIINNYDLNIKNSEIAILKKLDKSLYVKIKKAKGIVIDAIFKTHIERLHYQKIIHAPTIANAKNATILLQNGHIVTVNGVTGEIYSGGLIY